MCWREASDICTGWLIFSAIVLIFSFMRLWFVKWFIPRSIRTPEKHKSETHVQGSMMLKLVIARGINTAFLLFIVTKDTEQLDADTLEKVRTEMLPHYRTCSAPSYSSSSLEYREVYEVKPSRWRNRVPTLRSIVGDAWIQRYTGGELLLRTRAKSCEFADQQHWPKRSTRQTKPGRNVVNEMASVTRLVLIVQNPVAKWCTSTLAAFCATRE